MPLKCYYLLWLKKCGAQNGSEKKLNATKVVGCDGKLMVKYSIMTIQVNLQCLIPGIGPKSTWTVIIKILPSTYHHSHSSSTWNPQLFHIINFNRPFFNRPHNFTATLLLSRYYFYLHTYLTCTLLYKV